MKINRENYEAWFIDWLDNNLTGSQMEEMNYFLDQNPDLREEFNDLCVVNLKPGSFSCSSKGTLKRSLKDIPEDQFEIICAASVENDLSEEEASELIEIIKADRERERTLDIFRHLKLKAPDLHFSGKKKLLHYTIAAKVIRYAWIGFSAAAVVAILLMTGVLELKDQLRQETKITLADQPGPLPLPPEDQNEPDPAFDQPVQANNTKTISEEEVAEASTDIVTERVLVTAPVRIELQPELTLARHDNQILASHNIVNTPRPAGPDPDRSNIGRFIASRFRSKILNEPVPSDAPLKGYEIAEAGIDGLNKLLGWEMVLTRNNDENGVAESVNFNSRLLKFNTPVKNNQSAE